MRFTDYRRYEKTWYLSGSGRAFHLRPRRWAGSASWVLERRERRRRVPPLSLVLSHVRPLWRVDGSWGLGAPRGRWSAVVEPPLSLVLSHVRPLRRVDGSWGQAAVVGHRGGTHCRRCAFARLRVLPQRRTGCTVPGHVWCPSRACGSRGRSEVWGGHGPGDPRRTPWPMCFCFLHSVLQGLTVLVFNDLREIAW